MTTYTSRRTEIRRAVLSAVIRVHSRLADVATPYQGSTSAVATAAPLAEWMEQAPDDDDLDLRYFALDMATDQPQISEKDGKVDLVGDVQRLYAFIVEKPSV